MSENTEDINKLKRKAKELNDQASDYEFGFEIPSKKVFAVSGTKNPLRRSSVFIETTNSESIANSCVAEDKESPNATIVPSNKQNSTAPKNSSIVFDHLIDSSITQTNKAVGQNNDDTFVEFQLNAENDDDDLLLQNSPIDNNGNIESLLFRNNYFNVTSQQGNQVRAMCLSCGVNENNEPKTILKSQTNISSNFIDHLKVTAKYLILNLISLVTPISFNFQRKHKPAYEMYLAQKVEIKRKRNSKRAQTTFVRHGIDQDRFDKMIVKYVINGLQPLRSVEDESFQQLIFGKYI